MGDDEKKLLTDIHREVGVTQEQIKNVHEKLDTHITTTQNELKSINELDSEQNIILTEHKKSLDAHIEGVRTLKELYVAHREETKEELNLMREDLNIKHQESNARIKALEQPYDFIKYFGKVAAWVTSVLTVVMVALKILDLW